MVEECGNGVMERWNAGGYFFACPFSFSHEAPA